MGGLAALNAEVSRQAALVAYLNDFWMMMALTLLTIPLLVLIRRSRGRTAAVSAEAAH
jgi:DHA2 family multidrug resistance protein